MNKRVFILFFSFLLFLQSFRGLCEDRADYYYLKLLSKSATGKSRVNMLLRLSKMISDTAPSSGFLFAYDALKESTKLDYPKGKADSRMLIGHYFTSQRKYFPAYEFYLGSQKLYVKLKDQDGILEGYLAIGSLSEFLRDDKNAKSYFQKGLSLASSLHKWFMVIMRTYRYI